jgi:AraC-like DNA-binding protein
LREVEQSTTIVVEQFGSGRRITFRNEAMTHAAGAQRNTMTFGARDEWLECVVTACEGVMAQAAPQRTCSVRRILDAFLAHLPSPASPAEHRIMRALLVDVSLRWGHEDHWAYHTEFPDADCADDPSTLSLVVWQRAGPDARVMFGEWARHYIGAIERVHPRYRAVELRRDLDIDFAQPLLLRHLAHERGISIRCLQRDFLELTGRTIQQYVRDRRLAAAVGMLEDTSDKVEWIANLVGWTSRKNLNRALAKAHGASPSALRRVRPAKNR